MFSCECCVIFKITSFEQHLWTDASIRCYFDTISLNQSYWSPKVSSFWCKKFLIWCRHFDVSCKISLIWWKKIDLVQNCPGIFTPWIIAPGKLPKDNCSLTIFPWKLPPRKTAPLEHCPKDKLNPKNIFPKNQKT